MGAVSPLERELQQPGYRPSGMTSRSFRAAGLALFLSVTLASCTDSEAPQVAPMPQASDAGGRAGIDDIIVTEAALEPFIGMDASDAYTNLRRQHFKVRFGPSLNKFERNNIKGIATHPDVIIEALELTPQQVVVITKVSCNPRVAKQSRNYC